MSAEDRWIALIDESADSTVYRIGALVMPAAQRRLLAADLDAVMERANREFRIAPSVELHGVDWRLPRATHYGPEPCTTRGGR